MSSRKLYFAPILEQELCYRLDYYKDLIKSGEYEGDLYLVQAKADFGNGFFYCSEYSTVGEVIESGCGVTCEFYLPRNSVSGRCRHSRNTMEYSDQYFKLNNKLKLIKVPKEEFINKVRSVGREWI